MGLLILLRPLLSLLHPLPQLLLSQFPRLPSPMLRPASLLAPSDRMRRVRPPALKNWFPRNVLIPPSKMSLVLVPRSKKSLLLFALRKRESCLALLLSFLLLQLNPRELHPLASIILAGFRCHLTRFAFGLLVIRGMLSCSLVEIW